MNPDHEVLVIQQGHAASFSVPQPTANARRTLIPQSETLIRHSVQSDVFEQQALCFFFWNHVIIIPKVYSDIGDVVSSGLRGITLFTGYPARPYTLFAKQEDQKHAFSS
jgi:hypothetical protein